MSFSVRSKSKSKSQIVPQSLVLSTVSTNPSDRKIYVQNVDPSVLSSDPHERKLARRLRIQKRQEALQKMTESGSDVKVPDDMVDETQTEQQILCSAEVLEKILDEGNEIVSNVTVANDAREVERRQQAAEFREMLLIKLQHCSTECQAQYDAINARWPIIMGSNDPLDINKEMEDQKIKCDEVLARKDAVIEELKAALQEADNKYFEDQEMQRDDIRIIVQRIENQINIMETVYDREMDLIRKTLKIEKNELINDFKEKWEALYHQQEEEDTIGDEKRRTAMKDYEDKMNQVMTEQDEEFRSHKIQMESVCQDLEQQVEKTKAICLMNAEKLAYNLTVLKAREEESTIIKNQQKRKILKLVGLINTLKKNYAELQDSTKMEIDKLSKTILKAHKNIMELDEKSNHFTLVNEKQYMDIWNMNTDSANDLLAKILEADKIIHERTLGILWNPPEKTYLKKEDLESYCRAQEILKKKKLEELGRTSVFEDSSKVKKSPSETKLEREIFNNILKQITNCSGYLIEDKLKELIKDCTEEEKTIIKLDSVFQALLISSPEEINALLKFFMPYAYCPICLTREPSVGKDSQGNTIVSTPISTPCEDYCEGCLDKDVIKLVDAVRNEVALLPEDSPSPTITSSETTVSKFSHRHDEYLIQDTAEWKSSLSSGALGSESSVYDDDSDRRDSKLKTKFTCERGHVLQIQTANVTKAMKDVVTKYTAIEKKQVMSFEEKLHNKKFSISRNLTIEDVKNYWGSYREIFSENKEKLWDAILVGLNKYFEILKERHKYCTEITGLKRQNAELTRLLEKQTGSSTDGSSLLVVKSAKESTCK